MKSLDYYRSLLPDKSAQRLREDEEIKRTYFEPHQRFMIERGVYWKRFTEDLKDMAELARQDAIKNGEIIEEDDIEEIKEVMDDVVFGEECFCTFSDDCETRIEHGFYNQDDLVSDIEWMSDHINDLMDKLSRMQELLIKYPKFYIPFE